MALNIVEKIDGNVTIRRVLISVSDKTGLDELIPALLEINPEITLYSTGGTHARIAELLGDKAEGTLVAVSEYTGQPEMQGGLVKTLDFKIYLGILSETYNEAHVQDLQRCDATAIDMVIVNLYPFDQTVAQDTVTPEQARTNIDIGGPCMIRASAKNYLRVASVTDPDDYGRVISELQSGNGAISLGLRLELMKKAFAHTAAYDVGISSYFATKQTADVEPIYTVENS